MQDLCWFATRCKVCNALVYEAAAFLSKDAKEVKWRTWQSCEDSQRNTISQRASHGDHERLYCDGPMARNGRAPVQRQPGLGDLHKSEAISWLRPPRRLCQQNNAGGVAAGASNRSGCTGEQRWDLSALTLVATLDSWPADCTEDRASR